MSSLENINITINIPLRYANQLSIGDEILVQENNELIPEQVINVSNIIMQGNHYFKFLQNPYNTLLFINLSIMPIFYYSWKYK